MQYKLFFKIKTDLKNIYIYIFYAFIYAE